MCVYLAEKLCENICFHPSIIYLSISTIYLSILWSIHPHPSSHNWFFFSKFDVKSVLTFISQQMMQHGMQWCRSASLNLKLHSLGKFTEIKCFAEDASLAVCSPLSFWICLNTEMHFNVLQLPVVDPSLPLCITIWDRSAFYCILKIFKLV